MKTMRTFIATPFNPLTHQQIAAIADKLQQALRAASAPELFRWVDTQNIHLTLRFLGDTTADQAQRLATGVREVTALHPPFSLTSGGIGGFPTLQQPRVLWLGVGGDVDRLTAVQQAIEQRVQLMGFPAEVLPYSAHITLARAQRSATAKQLRVVSSVLRDVVLETEIALPVQEIVHMRSDLQRGGPVYRPLVHFPLAQDAG